MITIPSKTPNNLQLLKYKNDVNHISRGCKKQNQKFQTDFMQRIYSKIPHTFHMYNLTKLEACSERCQTTKVDLLR